MTRTCPHCGTDFETDYTTKVYCARRCKEKARERRARLELQAYRVSTAPPSRWHRLRVAVRWAWGSR